MKFLPEKFQVVLYYYHSTKWYTNCNCLHIYLRAFENSPGWEGGGGGGGWGGDFGALGNHIRELLVLV